MALFGFKHQKAEEKRADTHAATPVQPAAPVSSATPTARPRQEMIAAISAALAEELGTDISGIRILSVKKL